ncbi:hypothetical protein ACFU5O_36550 [Streptomyces sp. NPDC057445]|uniref:hypothetical protein n=1 Tax=Streptomyces sp. NPDC057445 TaxID=3346136 RepID=UPI00369E3776
MRQRERADLIRLEAFVREPVLAHTTQWHRVLQALGEAGGLCTAPTVELSTRGRHPLYA